MLEIEGRVDVRCSIDAAWRLICRFGDVARLIPTVEGVDIEGERIQARVATKLGVLPVSSRVVFQIVDKKDRACLKAEGVSYLGETIREQVAPGKATSGIDGGSVGKVKLHLDLRPGDAGMTAIIYKAEVEAEGRLKRIYQSILSTKAPAMMEEFAQNLRRALEGSSGAEQQPAAAAVSWWRRLWSRVASWWRLLRVR